MSNSQKQRLLDKQTYQKQLVQKKQQAAIERQQALIQQKLAQIQNAEQASYPQVKKKRNTKWYLMALLLIVAMFLPYPQVIVYEKLGVVAESIYIPSRFGSEDFMLDTNADVQIDNASRWLYLCTTLQNERQCNRFDIVEQRGFFSAISLYLETSP
ncbi:hypothetical protein [Catenovulum sediminis]|uniref:hypothetical protein n=1 Tax=Catenovulum sediminis TaxID=1740262 RepID=UPI00117DC46D|nr:hypothetical protein [Catenovulum sediminis]